ncbi:metal ABC transporter solute-binding protein, Zn/Mn family [Bifidobacterium tsurumiense]|uniref:Metals ABC transporter substrate-binding protein n=1 Tax=Bifidobacterium tsurumiense TaxID=356829 RepID=A0A087EFD8_9BIFI|nr:zinc ABC transporter substrate-binding protein [Bifidobacterium tsurumiense]KFJ06489.1 metals ABC transporter substrate-binding protein [Bifidobacterium tsurumiense]MDY4677997.1 zinc ABC transporter substrate-binding protein [Bifidobacterium tsurumiense]MSS12802.1 ABC transporter substrate-binding protein [Bifidobacterium tsurumiense]
MKQGLRRATQIIAATIAGGLLITTTGCSQSSSSSSPSANADSTSSSPISVVASVNQWGSLAEQIGGDDVKVTSILSTTTVDAHDFEPTAADIATLQDSAVAVLNGAGYDTWASKNLGKDVITVSAADMVGATDGDNPHLWFSKDARDAVAKELSEAFAKALPDKKDDFATRLSAWQKKEDTLESSMSEFTQKHPDATYAATEAVAYYLMADLGFQDVTPKGYAQSAASESEPAATDVQEFQELLEAKKANLLINNTQEASDATNMITGTAGRSDIPVISISEQMPEGTSDLTEWITNLVKEISDALTSASSDQSSSPSSGTDDSSTSTSTETPSNEGQTDPGK